MEIPNLPTDNLYKFMALSGLALFMFICYIGQKNYFDIKNEIDKKEIELFVQQSDTIMVNSRNKDMDDKKRILMEFFNEKYPALIKKIDASFNSILIYNTFYSLSLRIPELMPLYEKCEEYTKDYLEEQIEWSRNTLDKQIQWIQLDNKKKRLTHILIFYSVIALIGIWISAYGFLCWYFKIQIYQDEVLKNSALDSMKSLVPRKKIK